MSRKKQATNSSSRSSRNRNKAIKPRLKKLSKASQEKNHVLLKGLMELIFVDSTVFTKTMFHGNIKWLPDQLTIQALIWTWQESKCVTDAFDRSLEVCDQLGLAETAKTYTAFMNALSRYRDIMVNRLQFQFQDLAETLAEQYFRTDGWVLMAFDGSRATAPRTKANEKAFCAPNYGQGEKAKYGKKVSPESPRQTEAPEPQVWLTLMWHMGLRLPWTWRLGPSNSVERKHVLDILKAENFPEKTLFCGDAGFVGYEFWKAIMEKPAHFLVRVGANVKLLSEYADIKKKGGGIVLCWPKGMMDSDKPPLRLRLVRVKVGKRPMWLLTSVLSEKELTKKQMARYYESRWGVEVEFRGLKQTIDKHKLKCRNDGRLLAELDWSLLGMAFAELLSLSQQIPKERSKDSSNYDPKDRSLAETVRALRWSMRNLDEAFDANNCLLSKLTQALVQRYKNNTDKKARYRPRKRKNKLGDPEIRKLTAAERIKLKKLTPQKAA